MIARPVFRRSYHVEIVEPEGVCLLSEGDPVLLPGPLFCRLAPLLDGRPSDDVVAALGDVHPLQIRAALGMLERRGHLVEAAPAVSLERAAFWDAFGVDAAAAEAVLARSPVCLRAFGDAPRGEIEAALAGAGVRVDPAGELVVALTDDYLQEGLAALNAEALATARPFLLLRPSGMVLWIGPLIRPGRTACWECLAQRLRQGGRLSGYLQQRRGRTRPFPVARAAFPPTLQAGCALAAAEVARALAGVAGELEDRVLTLDVRSRRLEHHAVVRRPQCPACGTPTEAAGGRVPKLTLVSRPKRGGLDGGHRAEPPRAFLERYGHHVSWLAGAVGFLERRPIEGAPGLHVYSAGENRAWPVDSLAALRSSFRSGGAGKGVTDEQARASALGEALERYSGVLQGGESVVRASARALGAQALHPNSWMLYSARQYAERERWNRRGAPTTFVPEPFDESLEIDWTPAWSLTRNVPRYLPTASCYHGARDPGARFTRGDSNGAAAGGSLEEAILQGLFELLERDSVALWWYNRVRRPAVDLDSFDDPACRALLDTFIQLGRETWVLDLTSDLGIPVFAAVSRCVAGQERLVFGFGAHVEARVAVLRALTEMAQVLPWALDEDEMNADHDLGRWLAGATLASDPHLAPAEAPARAAACWPRSWTDDVAEDVRQVQAILEARGHEVLVLDQTRPDIGVPVARVFVPGLRHFWARFAPGRLYQVPVELGWLAAPRAEDELNPVPMFW